MRQAATRILGGLCASMLVLLVGCSEYPDPYTDACPEVSKLVVEDISPTEVRIRYKTSRLSPTRVRYRATLRDVEELSEVAEPTPDHDVTLTRLVPDSLYVFEIDTENARGPCPGDTVTGSFRTRPVNPEPDPTGTPVSDPTTSTRPF